MEGCIDNYMSRAYITLQFLLTMRHTLGGHTDAFHVDAGSSDDDADDQRDTTTTSCAADDAMSAQSTPAQVADCCEVV